MGSLKSLYKNTAQKLENLRPVPKYIISTLIFLVGGLVFGLVMTHFRGPNNLPFPWRTQAFVWAFLGVSSAFWSERRRKHPKPAPVITFTRQ